MRQFVTSGVLIGALISIPSAAAADPIRVTGGFFDPDFEGHIISFAGADFALRHAPAPTNLGLFIPSVRRPGDCEPCDAGQLVNESFTTPAAEYLGIGDATIKGTTYRDVVFRGTLDFQAEPFRLPIEYPNSTFYDAVTTFAFTGAIRGFRADSEVFNVSLMGTGRVSTLFFGFNNRFFREESGGPVFQFENVAATPEPSTLMLVGLGLAAAATAKRRTGTTQQLV